MPISRTSLAKPLPICATFPLFNAPHAHGYLSLALRLQDRYDEAIDALKTAVDYSPTIAWSTCRLAETLLNAGKYEDGRAIIQRGVQMWPDHPGLRRLRNQWETSLQSSVDRQAHTGLTDN